MDATRECLLYDESIIFEQIARIYLVCPSERSKLEITVEKITEQNQAELAQIALSVYLGQKCLFCGREYKTLEDLKETLWVGQDENRRLACSGCWKKYGHNT
jgi:hypothetical protein